MENIFKLHRDMPRQGPGDNESTIRAFDMMDLSEGSIKALDLGCGPGMQTVELAKHIDGKIIALDFCEKFLEELKETAKINSVDDEIEPFNGSMFELEKHFEKESFDFIWSEGAIYILGFENGINYVKQFIKPEGYLVVSEITWLTENPSKEAKDFWGENYPQMGTVASNCEIAKKAGYEVIGTFILPENSWWKNYYDPLKKRCNMFKEFEPENKELMELIHMTEIEMELFKKYNKDYNYAFYILRKI
nr:class I SAM-dependent methyltransferase [uncultured Cetobacterium sp.]